jgi:GGDEF domain-containing protein
MDFMARIQRRQNSQTRTTDDLTDHLETVRSSIPARFEVLGEILANMGDVEIACSVVGRELARMGVDLGEALGRLERTFQLVVGAEPTFKDVQALSVSWGEETLSYLHQLSCVDPLTGLASLAHLRARLGEVYQRAEQGEVSAGDQFALVLVDLPLLASTHSDRLQGGLRLVQVAENLHLVFPSGQTMARLNGTRLAALVERGPMLGRRVHLLRELLKDLSEHDPAMQQARIWIEGLPPSGQGAAWLLDELAREWVPA